MNAPKRAHIQSATASLLVLLASLPLGGCSFQMLRHGPQAVTARNEAAPPPADTRMSLLERMALEPAEPYWPYRIGEMCVAADSIAQAETALRTALARRPTYAPALALLSRLWFDAGRHADAVQMLESARAKSADGLPPELASALAQHYATMNRSDEARRVMDTLPRSARNGAATARVYTMLLGAAPDSAAELAHQAVEANPNSAPRQNNYGITLLRAGDLAGARRAFLRAIELDANLPGPYYNLAILEKYYAFDDVAAARWFDQYRKRANDDPDGLAGVFQKDEPQTADKKEAP